MQSRLVILGVNTIALALAVSLIGWLSREYYLIGVASSIMLFGIVSIAVGVEHREPSLELITKYASILRNTVLTLLEHLDIKPINFYAVPKNHIVYLIATNTDRPPKNPGSFIRAHGDIIYLGIEVQVRDKTFIEPIEINNIGDFIKEALISKYNIASRFSVQVGDNKIMILLENIEPHLLELEKKPLSPLTVFLLTMVSSALNRAIFLENELLEDHSLTITMKVL